MNPHPIYPEMYTIVYMVMGYGPVGSIYVYVCHLDSGSDIQPINN